MPSEKIRSISPCSRTFNSTGKGLREDGSQAILAIFQCRIFVFHHAIQNLKIKIHRTITLPVVLYGCETSSLILGEHKLRVFENRCRGRYLGLRGMR
jgi:hypothetical protein